MPLAPACRPTVSRSWRFHSFFGETVRRMFGRSKPSTSVSTSPPKSRSAISARVASSAVAVSAAIGTPGKRSRSRAAPGGHVVVARKRGIDAVGGDARKPERRNLILHQRHQRRDDDGQAAPDKRRHLEAERFTGTRRHDGEEVAAGKQRAHRRFLPRTEAVEAEDVFQDLPLGSVCGGSIHRGHYPGREGESGPSRRMASLSGKVAIWRAGRRRGINGGDKRRI